MDPFLPIEGRMQKKSNIDLSLFLFGLSSSQEFIFIGLEIWTCARNLLSYSKR